MSWGLGAPPAFLRGRTSDMGSKTEVGDLSSSLSSQLPSYLRLPPICTLNMLVSPISSCSLSLPFPGQHFGLIYT